MKFKILCSTIVLAVSSFCAIRHVNMRTAFNDETAITLPRFSFHEVLPGKVLPIADTSTETIRTSFSQPESLDQLIGLLDSDDSWVAAHLTLSILYGSPRGLSVNSPCYESSRRGMHIQMNFDDLYVDIRFSDDGYCAMQEVTFPDAAQQRVYLQGKWINRLKANESHTIDALSVSPRSVFPKLRATAKPYFQEPREPPTPEEVVELLESMQWGTLGFGDIVAYSPHLDVGALANPQMDRKWYVLLWLAQHGSDEQVVKAHIMLTFYGDPLSVIRHSRENGELGIVLGVDRLPVKIAVDSNGKMSSSVDATSSVLASIRSYWGEMVNVLSE